MRIDVDFKIEEHMSDIIWEIRKRIDNWVEQENHSYRSHMWSEEDQKELDQKIEFAKKVSTLLYDI